MTVERSGAVHAFGSRVLALGVVLCGVASEAHAAESPPGGPALRQARTAWDRGSLETAEPLYKEALEKGGLAPNEVLEGFVRLGSIRAALGKKDTALAAFRAASVLDAKFLVPSEAGARGNTLAARAKRDTASVGSIELKADVPREAVPGKPFKVTATLDSAHLRLVSRIGLLAKDGTTGKEITLEARPEESMEFEVASDVTLPGASILVRVDALDAHQNRLASTEERVKVPEEKGERSEKAAVAAAPKPKEGATLGKPPASDSGVRRGGSFWSTPWPYVIGGLAIAGAGAAVYFGTRPAESVSVGTPSVTPDS